MRITIIRCASVFTKYTFYELHNLRTSSIIPFRNPIFVIQIKTDFSNFTIYKLHFRPLQVFIDVKYNWFYELFLKNEFWRMLYSQSMQGMFWFLEQSFLSYLGRRYIASICHYSSLSNKQGGTFINFRDFWNEIWRQILRNPKFWGIFHKNSNVIRWEMAKKRLLPKFFTPSP